MRIAREQGNNAMADGGGVCKERENALTEYNTYMRKGRKEK